MSRANSTLSYTMILRIIGLISFIWAVVFFFFVNEFFYLVNLFPTVFKLTEPIPVPAERFFSVMASASMLTFGALAFVAAKSSNIRGYVFLLLFWKVAIVVGFGYLFFYENRYFAYLIWAVVEIPVILLVLWKMARSETPKAVPPELPQSESSTSPS